ncbi:MAG: C4-dicarboxylate ABC transporter [Nitrosomonas sp.]|jgi:hypothetical protein|uniref:C4-dicarboxylate ABC transporter n=1 Tax=Nitrosomonas sp. TaxID=42353 RepID=UPI0027198A1E|nr:C4-dicarboxylate ABC transporter [Nitrosomonas sp.]MDO8894578.1 C4-dicarboxylate ABC transporter [Nitrosomonas sp.]MDO9470696.1 C4-dicarboxylate ABC transporter [Nitrosomonas sp.]MDP1549843.1 C4-dicarboxylate ABC transporter [Nitrosomonas sp.]MDP1934709.1 C4-dicarboxylate ABC transporter [Nitrosomonas sp.]MDP3664635.1 C4-dicarboxylate ABC transporter [Nitrosomonas sp.]
MKTSHIFILKTLFISAAFFGVLLVFDIPESLVEWVIADVILIAYLTYLAITTVYGSPKTGTHHSRNEVTE